MALQSLSSTSKLVAYNNDVDLRDKTASPKSQGATVAEILALGPDALVNGKSSVYVAGTGLPLENGVELINGYTAAVAKIQSVEVVQPTELYYNGAIDRANGLYLFQTKYQTPLQSPGLNTNYSANYGIEYPEPNTPRIWRILSVGVGDFQDITILITDTAGNPETELDDFTPDSIPILGLQTFPAHLIVGPGEYNLPSDLVINHLVSVVSLTGQKDVNIIGGNVQVSSGANAKSTIVTGLNLQFNKFIVDTNLGKITVKNVEARAEGSFDSAFGGCNLSGTFIDCFGGLKSFASSTGANASGTFIRCDAKEKSADTGFSFGSLSGSTSGYFDTCGSISGSDDDGGGNSNFSRNGNTMNGYFWNCRGRIGSFGNGAQNVYARFYNCHASGSASFAQGNTLNAGKFYFCTSAGSASFGSYPNDATKTTEAKYYYCVANGGNSFGNGGNEGTLPSARSTYIGCSSADYSFGKGANDGSTDGLLYNCSMESSNIPGTPNVFAPVGLYGKIRNCLDGTFTIINLG